MSARNAVKMTLRGLPSCHVKHINTRVATFVTLSARLKYQLYIEVVFKQLVNFEPIRYFF